MKLIKESLTCNAVLGLIYKFSGIAVLYLSVPILINFLGPEQYGLWVTLTSVFGWIAIMDGGAGESMQNLLTRSIASSETILSRQLVSTTYILLSVISAVIFLLGLILIYLFPASRVIDTLSLPAKTISSTLIIMLASACIGLVLNLYIFIYNSQKQTARAMLSGLISQIAVFTGLLLISRLGVSSPLRAAAIIRSSLNLLVIFGVTILLFRLRPQLRPALSLLEKPLIRKIAGTGVQFFIIHLCWALINSTDNIIISSQLGSAEVTTFSLVYKIIAIGKISFFILLTPFWPHFADLYSRKNLTEIKKLISRYIKILLLINLLIFSISFFVPDIIRFWTGKSFGISRSLILFCSLFIAMDNIVGLFTYCLNAINRIKLQMYLYLTGGLLNIPLSLFLVNRTSLGSAGVIMASCICYLPLTLIMPVQVYFELKKVNMNGT